MSGTYCVRYIGTYLSYRYLPIMRKTIGTKVNLAKSAMCTYVANIHA